MSSNRVIVMANTYYVVFQIQTANNARHQFVNCLPQKKNQYPWLEGVNEHIVQGFYIYIALQGHYSDVRYDDQYRWSVSGRLMVCTNQIIKRLDSVRSFLICISDVHRMFTVKHCFFHWYDEFQYVSRLGINFSYQCS